MNPILTKIKGWWSASTPTQRITTLGGGALSLVLVAAIASYAGKPKFTILYGGLTPADQAAVVSEIRALNIPVQYSPGGSVEVPEDKVTDVNMQLATAGKLPKSAHAGDSDLGGINWMTTPSVERERLRSIAEGNLATTIEAFPGIQSARVHLTIANNSPFSNEKQASTASVSIVQGNTVLSQDQAQGIAMLVSHAVSGMSIKDVVVLNERMEPIFNGSDSVGTEHLAEKKLDLEQQVGKSEERKLQSALDTMFGLGSTLVTVRAEVDLDDEESTVSSHKVKDGAEVESAIEKAPMDGNGAPRTAAGTTANMTPGAPTAETGGNGGGTYTSKVSRMDPGTTDTVTRRKKATGGLRRMLINVAANTGKFKDETEGAAFVQSVDTFVRNEFKNQSDTTSFQALVTPVKFDTSAQEISEKAQEEMTSSAKRQQIISLLPIGALLIVGFVVVKSLGKLGKAAVGGGLTPALAGAGAALPGGAGGGALPGGMGHAMTGGGVAGLAGTSGSPLEAALSGHFGSDGMLGLPEGARRTEDGGIEFESDDERIRITKIKERTSIPLEQIRQMSTERPEAVAMLVKTWLMDEKR